MKPTMLAATILLLSLTNSVSAQNRSPEEALKNLRDIGLVVKYGETDGLAEKMRPNTLQLLRDRAGIMLSDAEIPYLQSTDEGDLAGKPRLVFTITLSQQTKAAAVHVEASIYERVRLWRDATKEMELATWVSGGYGYPTATYQMLVDVFDSQVQQFVKRYREVNPAHQQLASHTTAAPAQVKDDGNALQGLNGIAFFFGAVRNPSVEFQLEAFLKTLQSEAEKKFKEAGIPILKYADESERSGRPLFEIAVRLSGADSQAPAIALESSFWQRVRPIRDLKNDVYAVTWESQLNDTGPISEETVRQAVNRQLDQFINAYQVANAKVAAVRQ